MQIELYPPSLKAGFTLLDASTGSPYLIRTISVLLLRTLFLVIIMPGMELMIALGNIPLMSHHARAVERLVSTQAQQKTQATAR